MAKSNTVKFRGRKGVIEVGFSWIFILIAGAVILSLFSYIGMSQGSFFKNMINANLLVDLNAIFVGAQVSKDTDALIPIPEAKLTFDCNNYGIDGLTNSLNGRIVFAPKEIKTKNLITWSKPWSLGFRITNILYLTSPYIKYYILYDSTSSSLAQQIYNDLPKPLEKEMININSPTVPIQNQNYEKIIVLVLSTNQALKSTDLNSNIYDESYFKDYSDDEVTFVYVLPDSIRSGTFYLAGSTMIASVTFKNKKQDITPYPAGVDVQTVYDLSAVYGAFISGNQDDFQCLMTKAFHKARDVVKVYEARTDILLTSSLPSQCLATYSTYAKPQFGFMFNHLDDRNPGPHPGNILISDIANDIEQFYYINTNLERSSCPMLY